MYTDRARREKYVIPSIFMCLFEREWSSEKRSSANEHVFQNLETRVTVSCVIATYVHFTLTVSKEEGATDCEMIPMSNSDSSRPQPLPPTLVEYPNATLTLEPTNYGNSLTLNPTQLTTDALNSFIHSFIHSFLDHRHMSFERCLIIESETASKIGNHLSLTMWITTITSKHHCKHTKIFSR